MGWEGLQDFEGAKKVKGVNTTVEEAVLIALECIRRTAVLNKMGTIPKVRVFPASNNDADWSKVAERFNKHDKSKPFVQY